MRGQLGPHDCCTNGAVFQWPAASRRLTRAAIGTQRRQRLWLVFWQAMARIAAGHQNKEAPAGGRGSVCDVKETRSWLPTRRTT